MWKWLLLVGWMLSVAADRRRTLLSSSTSSISSPYHHIHHHHSSIFTSSQHLYHNARFCPATSVFKYEIDGFFRYPLDLYDPTLLQYYQSIASQHGQHHGNSSHHGQHTTPRPNPLINTHHLKNIEEKFYNCTSEKGKIFNVEDTGHPKHICTPHLPMTCPLIEENAYDAVARSHQWIYPNKPPSMAYKDWLTSSSGIKKLDLTKINGKTSQQLMEELTRNMPILYYIWQYLSDPTATIRVFVLGGSAAQGADSEGCYCHPKYETKCKHLFEDEVFMSSKFIEEKNTCSWSTFFIQYLRSISLANIELIRTTIGGTDFPFASQWFFSKFHGDEKIYKLQASDLIFLDYSLNDGLTYFKKAQAYLLEQGVELFFRQIYTYTNPKSPLPTVIVLEQNPFAYRHEEPYANGNIPVVDYQQIYSKFASHYRIPIFSYRDVVWSNATKSKQAEIHPIMLTYEHPWWYQHQFYADLYASIFENELREAKFFQQFIYQLKKHQLIPMNAFHMNVTNQLNGTIQIPKPLLTLEESVALCDPDIRPLLDLTAADFLSDSKKKNDDALKGYAIPSKYSRIGGYEIGITTRQSDLKSLKERQEWFLKQQHASQHHIWRLHEDRPGKAGWIDEYENITQDFPQIPSAALHRSILFHLDDPKGDFYKYPHLIHMQYLRTYINGGEVEFYVCGTERNEPLTRLSGLWSHPSTTKISVTQVYSKAVNRITEEQCKAQREANLLPTNVTSSFIEVVHVPFIPCFNPNDRSPKCMASTPQQKFKIIGIKVCRVKDGTAFERK